MKNENAYKFILVETVGKVGIITFNRPEALNALSDKLSQELEDALNDFEASSDIHCMIITGSDALFTAGADIKEMQDKTYAEAYLEDFITTSWDCVSRCRKPVIAAITGYCLGGGNEMAMMCDMIIATESAQFGQPEVGIGTLPGAGGTQRLPRCVGKALAMDMCLTARRLTAQEAHLHGLVSRVVPDGQHLEEAMKVAEQIASYSLPVIMMIKESINSAFETTLSQGLRSERRFFHAAFSLEDQKEGMHAFVEKRKPNFKGK